MVRTVTIGLVSIFVLGASSWRSPLEKYRGVWGGGRTTLGMSEPVAAALPGGDSDCVFPASFGCTF